MHTDMNAFDISGIPTTLAIIGVAALVVLALKTFAKKFPEVVERIKDATPWMGWTMSDTEMQSIYVNTADRYTVNRW